MNKIDRYLAWVMISSTVMVLLVLLGVQSFIQLAAQLQDVGKGDYSWAQALMFVPLMLPSDLYQLFPMAALIGCLLGLGRLLDSSELVVMRSSGMSLFALAKALLLASVMMLVVVSVVGEVVAPKARNLALTMKRTALTQGQMLQTQSGVWLREHNYFVHIARIENRRSLTGITLYELNSKNRLETMREAASAQFDPQSQEWTFFDVRTSKMTPKRVLTSRVQQESWPIHINTRLVTLSEVDPNQQTLGQLYRYVEFRAHSGLGRGVYAFVFWKRVFQPIASLVMILLAIPFVFGPMSRSTKGVRVVVGILVGFAFYITNQFFGPMSQVYQIPPILAALAPSVLCGVLGVWLLRRVG